VSDLDLDENGDLVPAPPDIRAVVLDSLHAPARLELVRMLYAILARKVLLYLFPTADEIVIAIEEGRYIVIKYTYRPAFHCPNVHTVII
jgi:hypothetical protein